MIKRASNGLIILCHFSQDKEENSVRVSNIEQIDKKKSWVFLNGVSQGDLVVCEGVGILLFENNHCIKFGARLGEGLNNYEKLMALKLVLLLANEKEIKNVHEVLDRR